MSELKQASMSPGMREMLETMHKLSGEDPKPSFLTKIFRPDPTAVLIAELVEALDEAEDYFEKRADADHDQGGYAPNEEMVLLNKIRSALSSIPKPSY